jgi:DNA-binding NarL/FixJ family response regulator
MAAELDVSRRTVQHRKKGLFEKCGVRSRRELLERLFENK